MCRCSQQQVTGSRQDHSVKDLMLLEKLHPWDDVPLTQVPFKGKLVEGILVMILWKDVLTVLPVFGACGSALKLGLVALESSLNSQGPSHSVPTTESVQLKTLTCYIKAHPNPPWGSNSLGTSPRTEECPILNAFYNASHFNTAPRVQQKSQPLPFSSLGWGQTYPQRHSSHLIPLILLIHTQHWSNTHLV